MNYITHLFIFFYLFTFSLCAEPHLVLHVDVNKTIIATDKVQNETAEHTINEILANRYSYLWDENVKEPITYKAYIDRLHSFDCFKNSVIHSFLDFLSKHDHPLYPIVYDDYLQLKKVLEEAKGDIFPSFYRLLDYLNTQKESYTIVFRTFGTDLPRVQSELEKSGMVFGQGGQFKQRNVQLKEGRIIDNLQELYLYVCEKEHKGLRDDFSHWNNNRFAGSASKIFPIDLDDNEVISFFFDDSIKNSNGNFNIVYPVNVRTGEALPVMDLIESGFLLKVDTYEAILNPEYFVNHLKKALENRLSTCSSKSVEFSYDQMKKPNSLIPSDFSIDDLEYQLAL